MDLCRFCCFEDSMHAVVATNIYLARHFFLNRYARFLNALPINKALKSRRLFSICGTNVRRPAFNVEINTAYTGFCAKIVYRAHY